eukprot:TRINITY_DN3311_c0_g1_i2.p2 TRINITY_DN3311_c0_g1~~TRINITY_DN3311_c0_g1_i2.p2  ORF type:complete len:135 (+),score=48.31 TRINITY_DN3311_c0_g1_i2:65-469(+)
MSHLVGIATRNPPFTGIVVRKKMPKTVMVQVTTEVKRKRYPRRFRHRKNYMVHDADDVCDVGDKVLVQKSRPFSKRKHWKVIDIVVKDAAAAFLKENPEYTPTKENLKKRRDEIQESMREVLLRSLKKDGGHLN